MANMRAGILGTGHSYPEGILTNADLEKMVETSDEWITTRTGIKQRRKAAPGEYTSQFAVRAARQAIERAGLQPADIDLILCATVTPDQILPSTGCIIQAELGRQQSRGHGYCRRLLRVSLWSDARGYDDSQRPVEVCARHWRRNSDAVRRLH